jgi:hypothetical protein
MTRTSLTPNHFCGRGDKHLSNRVCVILSTTNDVVNVNEGWEMHIEYLVIIQRKKIFINLK